MRSLDASTLETSDFSLDPTADESLLQPPIPEEPSVGVSHLQNNRSTHERFDTLPKNTTDDDGSSDGILMTRGTFPDFSGTENCDSITSFLPFSSQHAPLSSDFFDAPPEEAPVTLLLSSTILGAMLPTSSGLDEPSALTINDEESQAEPIVTGGPLSTRSAAVSILKYFASGICLNFGAFVVAIAMASSQTTGTHAGMPPALAVCVLVFLVLWLATIEGGQGCLVGLQRIEKHT